MSEYPKILISGNYNAFQSGYNSAGVYGFSGIMQTESFITPIYIGSSHDFKERICSTHLPQLRHDRHHNQPLKNYLYKYGWENLVVWQLEETEPTKQKLLDAEQKYLNFYGIAADGKSFNICPIAYSRKGTKASPETIAKMKRKVVPQERRDRIRLANTGRKLNLTAEQREARGARQRGEKHHNWGKKMDENFCKKVGDRFRGKKQSETQRSKKSESLAKFFKILSPDGEIIEGKNLKQFALSNGLCPGHLNSVYNGKRKSHKGYRKVPEEKPIVQI